MEEKYTKNQKSITALVGSKNTAKILGAEQALKKYYDNVIVEGIKVPSNVSDEPKDEDIYKGAKNRVENLIQYAKENKINADYYMGIESGITNLLGKWVIVNVAVIIDKENYESWGTSAGFPVPNKLVQDIIDTDLSKVIDKTFGRQSEPSSVGGVNRLTHNIISRIDLSRDAFIMALTQFINDKWNDK